MNGGSSCFERSQPVLPVAEAVRPRLTNGEAGRRIFDAVAAGDIEAVEAMVRSDPKLLSTHRRLAEGERPANGNAGDLLVFAVARCDARMVGALLELGADPDGTPAGLPLTLAALADDPLMATMLLQAGANADAHTPDTSTPLREALYFERSDAVELLIRGGADVNRADAVGGTPLEAALTFADYRSAEILMRAGANPWQVANKGTLPAALLVSPAKEGGDEIIRQRLLEQLRANAPSWPPPSATEVTRNVLAGSWPTPAMQERGFAVTEQALESMRRSARAGR